MRGSTVVWSVVLGCSLASVLLVAADTPDDTPSPTTRPTPTSAWLRVRDDAHGQVSFDVPAAAHAMVSLAIPLSSVMELTITVNGYDESNAACNAGFDVRLERGVMPSPKYLTGEQDGAERYFSLRGLVSLIAGSTFCDGPPSLAMVEKDTGSTPARDPRSPMDNATLSGSDVVEYYLLVESRAGGTAVPPPPLPNHTAAPTTTVAGPPKGPAVCRATVYVTTAGRTETGFMIASVSAVAAIMTVIFCRETLRSWRNADLVRESGYRMPALVPLATVPFRLTEALLAGATRLIAACAAANRRRHRGGRQSNQRRERARRARAESVNNDPASSGNTTAVGSRSAEAEMQAMNTSSGDDTAAAAIATDGAPRPPPSPTPSSDDDTCRVCREGDEAEDLVAPCRCAGSTKWVHPSCLQKWRTESIARNPRYTTHCEVCQHELDPAVAPPTRAPPFAKAVANQGVRLGLFAIVLLGLFLTLGLLSVETVGRASCYAPWHSVDDRFLAMFICGGAMAFAVDRIVIAAAYRVLSSEAAAAIEAGEAPAGMRHPALRRALATTAVLISLYLVILGYALGDFMWLVSSSVPRTRELRFGNGLCVMLAIAGLTWAGRSACPAPGDARRRAGARNLPAPLLGGDGDGGGGGADTNGADEHDGDGNHHRQMAQHHEVAATATVVAIRSAADTAATIPVAAPSRAAPHRAGSAELSSGEEDDEVATTAAVTGRGGSTTSPPPPLHDAHAVLDRM